MAAEDKLGLAINYATLATGLAVCAFILIPGMTTWLDGYLNFKSTALNIEHEANLAFYILIASPVILIIAVTLIRSNMSIGYLGPVLAIMNAALDIFINSIIAFIILTAIYTAGMIYILVSYARITPVLESLSKDPEFSLRLYALFFGIFLVVSSLRPLFSFKKKELR